MRKMAIKTATGLAAVVLLGVAGCGGGSDEKTAKDELDSQGAGSEDAGDIGDAGQSAAVDLCSLLETSEVETEFGERGVVVDGVEDFTHCTWDVGDQSQNNSGSLSVSDMGPAIGQTAEDYFAGFKELANDPVDVDGVGDEAYYETDPDAYSSGDTTFEQSFLVFRTGDLVLSLDAFFGPAVAGTQEKLLELAEHVLDRL